LALAERSRWPGNLIAIYTAAKPTPWRKKIRHDVGFMSPTR
jgi:hypothetical protein